MFTISKGSKRGYGTYLLFWDNNEMYIDSISLISLLLFHLIPLPVQLKNVSIV